MIEKMKNKLKAIALVEAIIEPEWEYRYFSFDSKWGPKENIASMRNGEGGTWFVLFQPNQVGYKCISPEDGLIDNLEEIGVQLPQEYQRFFNEPAFYLGEASTIWILKNQEWIKFGLDPLEWVIDLQTVLNWEPKDYKSWAEEYYEKDFDLEAISAIFEFKITKEVIKKLNSEISIELLKNDFLEIGVALPNN